MLAQVKCSFCNQMFDRDNSGGSLLATCPNCGKQNTVAIPGHTTQHLQILRNAPMLVGEMACPKCKAQIPRGAVLCIHCGYNLATGIMLKASRMPPRRKTWLLLGASALLLALAFASYVRWPKAEPGVFTREEGPRNGPAPAEKPAVPAALPDADKPASPADDERAAFDAQKAKAAQAFSSKLDETAALYRPGDAVELRLKTGRIIRGTLQLAAKGTNRVAIVATEAGTTIISLKDLDRDSRIRLDANYREEYIRRTLKLPSDEPMDPHKKQY